MTEAGRVEAPPEVIVVTGHQRDRSQVQEHDLQGVHVACFSGQPRSLRGGGSHRVQVSRETVVKVRRPRRQRAQDRPLRLADAPTGRSPTSGPDPAALSLHQASATTVGV